MIELSVIMATWNRCELLKKLILSLEDQSICQDSYQIIVCDSGSTDCTPEMMGQLTHTYNNLTYLNIETNNPAHKRNAAMHRAVAPLVVLMDDDLLVVQGFLEAHLRAHADVEKMAFCGQVRFPPDWVKASNHFRFRDSRHLGAEFGEEKEIPYHKIVMMNISFKREELSQLVGDVSETFPRYGFEDFEFGYRVAAAGIKLRYLQSALAYHYEAGGSVAQYARKLSIAARDSAPVLNHLVPEWSNTTLLRYLEPVSRHDTVRTQATKRVLSLLFQDSGRKIVQAFLEKTDHIGWLYAPWMFRYLGAAAYAEGVTSRSTCRKLQAPNDLIWYG